MDSIFFYILLTSFIATLVRSTFGFGESLVAVPLLIQFIPVETAVPLSVLLSIFIALVVVAQDHRKIHFNSAKWLILFAIPGIPLGLALLVYGNDFLVKLGLGMLILFYSVYSLFEKKSLELKKDNMFWLFACGFFSGVFGGAYGLNGPPLVVYGNMRKWSSKHFRATLQAYFLPASILGVAGYAVKGLMTAEVFTYFLVSLPAAIPALFLGRYLNHKLNSDSFFRYVYFGLALIAGYLVYTAFA
ncbi:hypothetical protein EDD80_104113 [Anseongella ginsenosidimutans]|uniref:Probable membrane transporter protein n=2 Tax=Anseongella ginsenosidimutans TaxID=496056 RepID=A0A4R3KSK3_9SPHI|nr:sulfite exporter TauE/SafE family protein [Anseongella ginsenosidimutans]TCS87766.1 hypothetical protein EDD80_104113 [Anseongella ginsenosidimutans]